MGSESEKENTAENLLVPADVKVAAPSPQKKSKKIRSLSMGPGAAVGLSVPLKEDSGNRRKSAIMPTMKSILSGGDDEKKRKEARRKSLANRRVSFAPEATLHTWDVIEYMRDATTSSASSESTRRASNVSQTSIRSNRSVDASPSQPATPENVEPPSTPPEQVEEISAAESPANQREMHQRKRRRNSGIPPMDFNNPDDALSSSPYSDGSPLGSDPIDVTTQSPLDSGSEETTAMSMDMEMTGQSIASDVSNNEEGSTSSSARLGEALRQAANYAGTRGIDFDENGDMSMEMATQDVTAAFQPWTKKAESDPLQPIRTIAAENQENHNPFSPGLKSKTISQLSCAAAAIFDGATQEMSMDITKAIGGIVQQHPDPVSDVRDVNDRTPTNSRGVKRRRSTANMNVTSSVGSPAKRRTSRRSSVRFHKRSMPEEQAAEDKTMDFTMVVGGIEPASAKQRADIAGSEAENSLEDDTMDFTMVVGGLKSASQTTHDADAYASNDEDMSMELTTTLDKTIHVSHSATAAELLSCSPKQHALSTPKETAAASDPEFLAITSNIAIRKTPSPRKCVTPPSDKRTRNSSCKSLSPTPYPCEYSLSGKDDPRSEHRLVYAEASGFELSARSDGQVATRYEEPLPSLERPIFIGPSDLDVPIAVKDENNGIEKKLTLSDSIRLLSTPRKAITGSPSKRALSTPKSGNNLTVKDIAISYNGSPVKKGKTPPAKNQKSVRVNYIASPARDKEQRQHVSRQEDADDVERVTLQEFLNLTNVRFMDLTTTKRRHTGYPGPDATRLAIAEDENNGNEQLTMENNVAVALGVVPMLSMYTHSCQEMKHYIAGGRSEIESLAADAYETQPPLFREYLAATPEVRAIMDNQFKNVKTNARLLSKSGWHAWRAQLLTDLITGLAQSSEELNKDEEILKAEEAILADVLPSVKEIGDRLQTEYKLHQQRAEELESADREELDMTRKRLSLVDTAIEEKEKLLATMQQQLQERASSIEILKERKIECQAEIAEAQRVREACRGWSAAEVASAKEKLSTIEKALGWTVASAFSEPSSLTLCYHDDLELFFQPSAFGTHNAQSLNGIDVPGNSPISLTYVGDHKGRDTKRPCPLSTTKRFFLQLLRAYIHSISQAQTPVSALLSAISQGWSAAVALSEAVRRLEQVCGVEELILSDDKMALDALIVLPSVQTKVRARFVVSVKPCAWPSGGVQANITVEGKVVYGERYKEETIVKFLSQYVQESAFTIDMVGQWASGVEQLRLRLIERGKKGERVQ